jgi:hypothetical protein
MSLEMRGACEKCGKTLLQDSTEVYICSFECTWCGACAKAMNHACPNCGGELLRRPRRTKKD